jgi:hypothetical protein
MFIDTTNAVINTDESSVGAGLDMENLSKSDMLAIGSGIVGAGVLGTGLIVAAYAAPAPIIGGTAVALGLGITASMMIDDIEQEAIDNALASQELDKAMGSITDHKGAEVAVEGL